MLHPRPHQQNHVDRLRLLHLHLRVRLRICFIVHATHLLGRNTRHPARNRNGRIPTHGRRGRIPEYVHGSHHVEEYRVLGLCMLRILRFVRGGGDLSFFFVETNGHTLEEMGEVFVAREPAEGEYPADEGEEGHE